MVSSRMKKNTSSSMPKNSFRLWYEEKKNPVDYWISLLGLEELIEKKKEKKEQHKSEVSSLLSTFYRY